MNPDHTAGLKRLIEDFVAGKIPFWSFHNAFIEGYVRLPGKNQRGQWSRAYQLVTISAPDPVSALDQARGVIGEEALRIRLAAPPW